MEYSDFLQTKIISVNEVGFDISENEVNSLLFPFQRDIVMWAIRLGRAAIFADCGMGKSFMQLEWARIVSEKTKRPVLIIAPLGVTGQTVQEAEKLGMELKYCRSQSDSDGVQSNSMAAQHSEVQRHSGANRGKGEARCFAERQIKAMALLGTAG